MRYNFRTILALVAIGTAALASSAQDDLTSAWDLAQNGKPAQAESIVKAILEDDASNHRAHFVLGFAFHMQSEYEEAIDHWEIAADDRTMIEVAHYNIACAKSLSGDTEGALASLNNAYRHGFFLKDDVLTDSDLVAVRDDPAFVPPSGRTAHTFTATNGVSFEYIRVDPACAKQNSEVPTLVVFGPGGMSKSAVETILHYYWGEQLAQRGWRVYGAAVPADATWRSEDGSEAFGEFVASVIENETVRGGKIHLAGCSGGGPSAWTMAIDHAEMLHSLIVAPGSCYEEDLSPLKDLRIMQVVGDRDTPWLGGAKDVHAKLESLSIDARLHIIENGDHVIDSLRGDGFALLMDELRTMK
jgi:tetratricopeptide (TPR) repeat protein